MSSHNEWYKYNNGVAEIYFLLLIEHNCHSVLEQIAEQHNPQHWVIDLSTECFYYLCDNGFGIPKGTAAVHIFELLTESAALMGNAWHFLSGAYDVEQDYADWLLKTQRPQLIQVRYVPMFFHWSYIETARALPRTAHYTPRFYCTFNNRFTASRLTLLTYLAQRDQIAQGYSTWRFTDNIWQHLRPGRRYLAKVYPSNIPFTDSGITNQMSPTLKQIWSGPWTGGSTVQRATYQLTQLEIVTETYDETDSIWSPQYAASVRYITEKTARPLMEGQPFISINSVNTQSMLTELGFVDYSKYIDYSFDRMDYGLQSQRIEMVANEMMRLQQDNFTKTLLTEELAHNKHLARQLGKINPVLAYISNLY